jgi:hypothetical protein
MKSIDQYLSALERELAGSDPATVRDAQADAGEHLHTAVEIMKESNPDLSDGEAIAACIDEYGTPAEIAAAYKGIEDYLVPALAPRKPASDRSVLAQFFGIIADPRAWGSLLYMLLALVTGVVYFSWAVTGLSLSLGLAILIFGVPVAILFLLSVRGISFLEGRMVEGLLGVQMPRRMTFTRPGMKWMDRLKMLATDRQTWFSILYMLLQLPLGIIYFTLVVTLVSLALSFMAVPFVQTFVDIPLIYFGSRSYYFPFWSYPLVFFGGVLIFLVTMHLAKLVGNLQGRYAKTLLIGG